jgi:hypothetical protein
MGSGDREESKEDDGKAHDVHDLHSGSELA